MSIRFIIYVADTPLPPNLPMICCGQFYIVAINRVLTLPDTDTDNNADTDKMGLQPNCICVSVGVSVGVGQCEPLHTILYNPFLSAATKLGQGNIFRSVCQEFCPLGGGGCLPQCMLGYTHLLGSRPPREQTPPPGSRLQHTVNERAVRILLECILVLLLSVSGSVNTS